MTKTLPPWTEKKAARRAVGHLDEATTWMRSDMASVMRQISEEHDAFSWSKQNGRTATGIDSLIAWLTDFYGVPITRPDADAQGLSAAAQMTRQVLTARAGRLRDSPVLVADRQVTALLATVATSGVYAASIPDRSGVPMLAGHLEFADPLPCIRRRAGLLGELTGDDGVEHIAALSWFTEDTEVVRVNDWTRPELPDTTGNASIDRQVQEAVHGSTADTRLPYMLWSSEWQSSPHVPVWGVDGEDQAVQQSRDRMVQVRRRIADGRATRWMGEAPIPDTEGTLMAQMTMAVWDLITAGLVGIQHETVPNPGHTQQGRPDTVEVTVLTAPDGA
ncbi:MAG: hypothetical protein L0H59_05215 [Tomitella sp.]|nr:hypothetical protein [Tomitella sp.]